MIDINKMRRLTQAAIAKMNASDPEFASSTPPLAILELLDRLEAAEKERDDVAQQLVQSEVGKREISEAHDALQVEVGKLKDLEVSRCVKINGYIVDNARLAEEVVRLQAKITEMEQQKPVGTAVDMPGTIGFTKAYFIADKVPLGSRLYALPGAKGE